MRLLSIIPGLIFGLVFAGGGLLVFSETGLPTWQDWYAMQKWQPAQAILISLSAGDNQTQASYRYEVNGIVYQGDRVYVTRFSDNIGSYHQDLSRRLRKQHLAGQPVTIWVDPFNPHESVIDRNMRWGLFALISSFCSIFVFIGLLIVYASICSNKQAANFERPSFMALRREWKQRLHDPEFNHSFIEYTRQRFEQLGQQAEQQSEKTDWKTREGWGSAKIRSQGRSGVFGVWGFTIFWNAISTPLLFILPRELEKNNYPALIALLFPLVGAVLLYKAVLVALEYRRFGRVLFEMDPFPGAVGGQVGGQVHISNLAYDTAVDKSTLLAVRLECVYSFMSGSGKDRSRRETIKWAEEGMPQLEKLTPGVRLRFTFDLPDHLPEADAEQSGAYHFWRLTLKAEIPGVDLNRNYNIPVIKSDATSRFIRHNVSDKVAARKARDSEAAKFSIAQGNFDLPGLSRAMRFSQQGDEIKLVFPMFRNKVLTLFAAVFAGGFGFASYSMFDFGSSSGGFGILTSLYSIPFVLVALTASIATIYLPFNNLRVSIRSGQVTVLRRLLFVPVFYKRLDAGSISYLSIKRSGSTGQGVDKIEHFKLLANDRWGKSVTIAEDLDGEDVAGHFRDYLAQRLIVGSQDFI
jgi:hypothetical protein